MTGARSRKADRRRPDHPPRSAETPPPKPERPIAAAGRAEIVQPVGQTAREPDFEAGVGAGAGSKGAGPGAPAANGLGVEGLVFGRARTHGVFRIQAAKAQQIKRAYRDSPNWSALTDGQRQALEANADKVARILCGDADHPDHWRDLAGYAVLGESCPISGAWRT